MLFSEDKYFQVWASFQLTETYLLWDVYIPLLSTLLLNATGTSFFLTTAKMHVWQFHHQWKKSENGIHIALCKIASTLWNTPENSTKYMVSWLNVVGNQKLHYILNSQKMHEVVHGVSMISFYPLSITHTHTILVCYSDI